ncbi:MAG: hypothetical protein IJ877_03000 [Candidatus Gastranaerophilales bacterium]|nr:hypothetical protein [Candidatus Gastranaerophilales bacterium]
MKLKIILCNVIVLIIALVGAEIYFYNKYCDTPIMQEKKVPYFYDTEDFLKTIPWGAYYPDRFREYRETNQDKKPILLIGCSYAYGQWLDEKDSLGGLLEKLTKRHVYNLAVIGQDSAVASMLLDVEGKNKRITKTPEYVIYPYMFHNLVRLSNPYYLSYYRKMGFIEQKDNILYKSYLYSHFKDVNFLKRLYWDIDFVQHQEIYFKILAHIKKTCDKNYPNSKFVVLIYDDINFDLCPNIWHSVGESGSTMNKLFEIMYSQEFKQKMEDLGIEVIHTQDLIGRVMDNPLDRVLQDPNRPHPSASAWAEITPKLVERLKL